MPSGHAGQGRPVADPPDLARSSRYGRAVGSQATPSNPDHKLAPEQFAGLNEAFYATRPWEYFRHREQMLILAAGASDGLLKIAEAGVKVGRLQYELKLTDEERSLDAENRARFVIAESEVLLHHVSETLLRLYLAHEPLPECPWLDVARVRAPAKFKRQVEERFLGTLGRDERRRRVALVFFGGRDPAGVSPQPSQSDWDDGADNIEAFLCYFAQHFLEADVYNSLKHGLAVRPGDAKVQLGDGELLKAEGPSIEYLSIRESEGGQRRWCRSTTWIDVDRSISLVFLATRLIESLWGIARARYTGELPESISLFTQPKFKDVMTDLEPGESAKVVLQSTHMELLYYAEPEAVLRERPA